MREMKKSWVAPLAGIIALALAARISAEEITPIDRVYAWDDARMDIGYFYHYVFTDMKGKGPKNTYYYVTGKDEFTILSNAYEGPYQKAIALSPMKISRERLYWEKQTATNLLPASDKSYRDVLVKYDFGTMKTHTEAILIEKGKDTPYSADEKFIPNAYLANSTGMEFAFFFRQLKDGVEPFTFTYVDALKRSYAMDCRYEKDETLNGIPCRKYSIMGRGILAKAMDVGGAVWTARDDSYRYMVKHTMNMRVDWDYANTMVVLAERKPMSPEEWKAFQDSMVLAQKKSSF
jgi:hypothetical protein